MATAHHSQNESYPLQLKIRSHETPATTDLSEPLMNQALYLYFFHPIKLFRSNPWFWPHPVAVLPVFVWKTSIHYYAAMLITSITQQLRAQLSHSPGGLHHPIELTLLPPAAKSNPCQKYGCSWWFQPHLKNISQMGSFPQASGWKSKIIETTT